MAKVVLALDNNSASSRGVYKDLCNKPNNKRVFREQDTINNNHCYNHNRSSPSGAVTSAYAYVPTRTADDAIPVV